ncbi:A/B/D/E cyclin [Trichoderma reesei RUT C-30]|uniref:A/B/D/E cyclin n=1 Tax=Hypocrea jecorina (strain ATCC 56765 / BCRC 32924 / NRRL 11460 / Rut C-30) TaxID=1344414 RepID=A0A024S8L6_HYPJR|nr:A/B/D/E cyclin [Trichoderma reesei RUT C-30]
MTRAKSAALNVADSAVPSKAGLQTKRTVGVTTSNGLRKRAALGDVSNVSKTEAVEAKKVTTASKGLVSKAAAPTGIQKSTRPTAGRTALSSKELKKPETKKSGAGTIGPKRKVPTAAPKEEVVVDAENKAPQPAATKSAPVKSAPVKAASAKAAPAKAAPPQLDPKEAAKAELLANIKSLDEEDLDDPLMVAEYANDIFDYLRELEVQSIPNPDYMSHQDDLEWKTRGILIDWLIEVHTRFHLLPETLFLAVNIIDRFLSEKVVQLDRLQLVGITAMFIASKYEEVLSPHVENFKKIADDGFSEAEILSAERFILSTLNYDLSYPNPMNFLRRVSKADNYDIQSRTIGKYLTEISLLDHRFMVYRPSHVAAASMYLARLMLDRGEWDPTIAYYAGYTEDEVEPVVNLMVDYLARPPIHEAFFKKYASKKFLKASILSRQWAKKNAPLFGIEDLHLSLDQIS